MVEEKNSVFVWCAEGERGVPMLEHTVWHIPPLGFQYTATKTEFRAVVKSGVCFGWIVIFISYSIPVQNHMWRKRKRQNSLLQIILDGGDRIPPHHHGSSYPERDCVGICNPVHNAMANTTFLGLKALHIKSHPPNKQALSLN